MVSLKNNYIVYELFIIFIRTETAEKFNFYVMGVINHISKLRNLYNNYIR